MPPKVTRQTPIGELVMNYPEAVEVLLKYGFHCIGCGLSGYETLEEGAAAHGFDEKAIDSLVSEINEAARMPMALEEEAKPIRNRKQKPRIPNFTSPPVEAAGVHDPSAVDETGAEITSRGSGKKKSNAGAKKKPINKSKKNPKRGNEV